MKTNKLLLACVALAVAGTGTAHANSIATGWMDITNLKWVTSGGTALTAGINGDTTKDILLTGGANSAFGSASLTPGGAQAYPAINSNVLAGGQIPLTKVNVGPGGPGTGPAAPVAATTTTPTTTYSYGQVSLSGAVVDISAVGIVAGANANTVAQVQIDSNASGGAVTNLNSNVGFDFTATTDLLGTHFTMSYLANATASIVNPFGAGDSAIAGTSWLLTITDKGISGTENNPLLSWNPTQLNNNANVASSVSCQTNGVACFSPAGGSLDSLSVNGVDLLQGHKYSFGIVSNVSANANRDVLLPEPASLSLLGIGLLGIVANSMRKSKKFA